MFGEFVLGACVGPNVSGDIVGVDVPGWKETGAYVGEVVGLSVGHTVGSVVVGDDVVGAFVGDVLGFAEGEAVEGLRVGLVVGLLVGANVIGGMSACAHPSHSDSNI